MRNVRTADAVLRFPIPSLPLPFPLPPSPFLIIPPGETPPFLSPLPIEALRLPAETVRLLHELGITRIGQLEALPREEFRRVLGPCCWSGWTRPSGVWTSRCRPVPRADVRGRLVGRVSDLPPGNDRGGVGASHPPGGGDAGPPRPRGLAAGMPAGLSKSAQSTIQHLKSFFVGGAVSAHGRRGALFPLVQLQLERLRISSPVTGVRVAATLTAPLEPRRQAMLFDLRRRPGHGSARSTFAALVERLSSRLGRRAVAGVRLRPEAQPELSWHYDPLVEHGGVAVGRKTLPDELPPRPLRLLPRPRPLLAMSVVPDGPPLRFHDAGQEHQIAQSWGPERIETGWWRGRPVGRDYFRVETAAGRRFWLFRRLRDGKWFLHGMFD